MIVRILVLFTVSFPATWCIAQPAPAPSQQEPERIQSLNAVRIRVESRLRDLDNEIRQLQVKLGIDGGVVSSLGVKEIELSARVRQRIRAEIGAARARDAYERLVKALQEKQDPPELAAAVRNDNYVRELRRRVDDLEIRRDVLASKGTTGAHPQATELQAEIDAVRKKLDAAKSEILAGVRIQSLSDTKERFERLQTEYDAVLKQTENLKMDLGELANAQFKLMNMMDERKGLGEQLIKVKMQIEEATALHPPQKAK